MSQIFVSMWYKFSKFLNFITIIFFYFYVRIISFICSFCVNVNILFSYIDDLFIKDCKFLILWLRFLLINLFISLLLLLDSDEEILFKYSLKLSLIIVSCSLWFLNFLIKLLSFFRIIFLVLLYSNINLFGSFGSLDLLIFFIFILM